MEILFQLPTWLGILIVVSFFTITGLIVVILTRKLIKHRFTKQYEKIGQLFFRVSAGVIALLISLSYANERVEQIKLRDSMELEASLIVNVIVKLQIYDSEEAVEILKKVELYVDNTIDDKWENIEANPFFSDSSVALLAVMELAYNLPTTNKKQEKIKEDILSEVNQIFKLMQVRIYSQGTYMPYLVYILFVGMLIIWLFFTVYEQNIISLGFLTLYNIFIAILIYFIFILSNPLIGELKMDANSFSIIKTKGFDQKLK